MTKNKNQNILYTWMQFFYIVFAMFIFLVTSRFKWIDLKEFDFNKYSSNNSKGYVFEVNLEYTNKLKALYNDCPLTP